MLNNIKNFFPEHFAKIIAFWVGFIGVLEATSSLTNWKLLNDYKYQMFVASVILMVLAIILDNHLDKIKMKRTIKALEINNKGLNQQIDKYQLEIKALDSNRLQLSQQLNFIFALLPKEYIEEINDRLNLINELKGDK